MAKYQIMSCGFFAVTVSRGTLLRCRKLITRDDLQIFSYLAALNKYKVHCISYILHFPFQSFIYTKHSYS